MSKIKDLKLPVTILHEMDNVQYKISATLVDINESMDTCTLEFNNGRIEKDIPMSDVYITEGIIDTIKNFGKKFKPGKRNAVKWEIFIC